MRPNQPFELHVGLGMVGAGVEEAVVVIVGSLQPPNQPGCLQLDRSLEVGKDEVEVIVGAGVADRRDVVVVISSSSLQPNQPGVLQVLVEVVVGDVEVLGPEVVVSSRQPHQPGVLQVSVLVLLLVDVEEIVGEVVVRSVPLLSKNSQG